MKQTRHGNAAGGGLWSARLAIAALLVFHLGLMTTLKDRVLVEQQGDFPIFYRAAVLAHQNPGTIYDFVTQDSFQGPGFGSGKYFYHPPFELLWLLPFGFLSYAAAFWAWMAETLLLLLASGLVLGRQFRELRCATGIPVTAFLFAFFPVVMIFFWGQVSALLILLVVLAFQAYGRKRYAWCGVLLGLGLFKFQFIMPLAAILAFRPKPRLLAAFAATAAALAGVSWLLVGKSGLILYWQILHHHGIETASRMPNLRGMIQTLGGPPVLTILLSIGLVLYLGTRAPADNRGQFATALTGAELVSYHGHIYDLSLLLIPILLLFQRATGKKMSPSLWPMVFFFSPLYVVLARYSAWFLLGVPVLALMFNLAKSERILMEPTLAGAPDPSGERSQARD